MKRILVSVGRGKGCAPRKMKTLLFLSPPILHDYCPSLIFALSCISIARTLNGCTLHMITRLSSMDPRDTRDNVDHSIQNLKMDSLNIYPEINKLCMTTV